MQAMASFDSDDDLQLAGAELTDAPGFADAEANTKLQERARTAIAESEQRREAQQRAEGWRMAEVQGLLGVVRGERWCALVQLASQTARLWIPLWLIWPQHL